MGDLLTDYHHFLLASKPMNEKKEWRYLIDESSIDDWHTENYDDSHWERGLAPFGTERNLQSTYWGEPGTILIRTHFDVDESEYNRIKKLYITVFHDEDCWIYINGEEAMSLSGYNTDWENFSLDKKYLRPGTNLIAIKCTQTIGGQLIDAGIYASLEEETGIKIPEQKEYKYTVHDNLLSIYNVKQGTPIRLYSIDGKLIKQIVTIHSTVEIPLPARGIYVIKSQDKTLKIIN
jgi:hypothetical protein